MTKILSIVWYKVLPAKYGGQKGIAHFNKYLGRQLPLTCICSSNNEPAEKLSYKLIPALPVTKWQFLNPFTWRKITRTAKEEKPTHIILEHPYHGIAGWLAKKKTGAKLVVHSHNTEFLRFREQGKWWWRLLKLYEKWTHRRADLSLFKTTKDLDQAIKYFRLNPDKCAILPYGIDPEEKKPPREEARKIIRARHQINGEAKILLFAGTLDYKPNADAVETIYNEIAPRLEEDKFSGKIIICGRNRLKNFQYLKKLSHPLVIAAGEADDISNYFSAADVFINPVSMGGGVQTKNIDSVMQGLPVVCFDLNGEPDSFNQLMFLTSPGETDAFIENIYRGIALEAGIISLPPAEYYWNNIISKNLALLTSL